jgi:t-SNARE complex subunit (syntaxin)
MSALVAHQGEILNQIDAHVSNAVVTTEAGIQAMKSAVKHQKSARKKMFIILGILVVVAVAIGIYFAIVK